MIALPAPARTRAARAVTIVLQPLVAAALALATTWSVLNGGWVNGAGATLLVAVAAVAEATLLAWAGLPRWVFILSAPLLAVAAVVPFTIRSGPAAHATLRALIPLYARAMVGGLESVQDWPFIVGMCTIVWLCGFVAGWCVVRERNGVMALLPCALVIAINDVRAPAPLNQLEGPQMAVLGAAMMVIATTGLASARRSWRERRLSVAPRVGGRAGLVAVPLAAIVILSAQLLPALSSRQLTSFFSNVSTGTGQGGNGSGNSPGQISFTSRTVPGGPLLPNDTRQLVYTDSAGPVYLAGVVEDAESDGNWSDVVGNVGTDTTARTSTDLLEDEPTPYDTDPADGGTGHTAVITTNIRYSQSVSPSLTLVYPVTPLTASVATSLTELVTFEPGGGPAFNANEPPPNNNVLEVVSANPVIPAPSNDVIEQGLQSTATVAQLEAAGDDYPGWVTNDTYFTDEKSPLVTRLADQWVAGATNNFEKATDIQNHLRQFQYTLDPPATPSNQEPLDYFLFTSNQGYCQYFASAMGEMLRAEGIPSRLVSGYGPGTAETTGGVTVHVVTGNDAHVWVEAYFPGYGWIPFEPTPASADGAYEPFKQDGSLPPSTTPGPIPSRIPTPSVVATPTARPIPAVQPSSTAGTSNHRGDGALLAFAAVLLVLVVLLLLIALPRGVSGAWRRLMLAARLWGAWPRPPDTPAEAGARLVAIFRDDPTARRAITRLAQLVGRDRFDVVPLSDAERREAIDCWRAVMRRLPALFVGGQRRRISAIRTP